MADTKMQSGDLHKKLERLRAALISYEDPETAVKIGQLERKWEQRELTLAFLGHFSAGKSSLINALCGEPLLPSGPLPTTANAAIIRDGDRRAEITLHPADGSSEESVSEVLPSKKENKLVLATEEMEEALARYCKDGESYATVEIWGDIPLLKGGGAYLDTPGVDSTDAAHASATDAALHLADVVFYMMDYNHVQSETNLAFAKSLSDLGKPLVLIINQVDKHREAELSFTHYKETVEQTFTDWRIGAAGILYLSVKHPEHPLSQWKHLVSLIGQLLAERDELLERGIQLAAQDLTKRHLSREREVRPAEAALMNEQEEELESEAEASLQALQSRLDELSGRGSEARDALMTDLGRTLDNAPIMPASLRDLIQVYLESQAPGFRAGGLFASKKRTEQEREQRLAAVTADFAERVEAGLDVHVRERLRAFGRELGIWNAEHEARLEQALPRVDSSWISGHLKEGARISPEYVMNFSADLRSDTLGRFRRASLEFAEQLLESRKPQDAEQTAALEEQLAGASELAEKAKRRRKVREALDLREAELMQMIGEADVLPAIRLPEIDTLSELTGRETVAIGMMQEANRRKGEQYAARQPSVVSLEESVSSGDIMRSADSLRSIPPEDALGVSDSNPQAVSGRLGILNAAADRLHEAAALIEPLPTFGSALRFMRERETSLRSGRFTLALFGAFSAGKSSFANALLGESYLPVSPHPTTAAINRIMAPERAEDHGRALVVMKTREELLDDLSDACELLGLKDPALGRWRSEVRALTPDRIHPSGRAHYSFLRAADRGFDQAESLLGTETLAEPEEFRLYAADESQACFVKRIDLYIDSEWTRQGIVLVDTPGADSVHARHTGVTFDYMKNADALVFVTYYNHAFSRADRQFLSQLGRVKGSDAVDKTFFIVNAADLADSEEECRGVTSHLEERLRGEGILQPRIYPVSSLQALQRKQSGEFDTHQESTEASLDRFADFERELMHFAAEELAGLAAAAADREIESARERLNEWTREANQGEQERLSRLEGLEHSLVKAEEMIRSAGAADKQAELVREIRELLFHVRQRIEFRFNAWFAESFNPALLHGGSTDLKASFLACGRELSRMIAREVENELLATGLRIEKAGQRMLRAALDDVRGRLTELGAPFDLIGQGGSGDWETLKVAEVQLGTALDWTSLWPMFKSPKVFFEQRGREAVREAALTRFREALQHITDSRLPEFEAFYGDQLTAKLMKEAEELMQRAGDAAEGIRMSLSGAPDTELWQQIENQLEHILASK
ncbi:dynamin family protein [Saccharibacillus kuerlensis]|uniref:GTPase n=1 Tax=Saccharibacillus kuerlensis TaxID=459527 RepID=A0ABQ2L5F2_9BACL|nr:dynamin family protein [Saccharibacillus kuerlensis]GGO04083.1 GTPase [Saccharibacillus kuerlensis]